MALLKPSSIIFRFTITTDRSLQISEALPIALFGHKIAPNVLCRIVVVLSVATPAPAYLALVDLTARQISF